MFGAGQWQNQCQYISTLKWRDTLGERDNWIAVYYSKLPKVEGKTVRYLSKIWSKREHYKSGGTWGTPFVKCGA